MRLMPSIFPNARALRAAGVGILLAVAAAPAFAQNADIQQLLNRLGRLERDIQTLSAEVYRGGAPSGEVGGASNLSGGYATQVEARLQSLERQIQMLTGSIEEVRHQTREVGGRLDRALADIEFRLTQLEGGGAALSPPGSTTGAAPSTTGGTTGSATVGPTFDQIAEGAGATDDPAGAAPTTTPTTTATASTSGILGTLSVEPGSMPANPPATPTAPTSVSLPSGSVSDQYNYAYGLLAQGDYARSEQALTQFLAAHPDEPLASNAQYWLGETYYIRGQFNDAAIAFAEGYQKFPDGAKAVDSLLKLGMSLSALGQTQDACLTFAQLQAEFPTAPAGISRRAEQERSRLQCG